MNVMKRAWEIARGGVKRFGGKARDYFQQALVMAWEQAKNIEEFEMVAVYDLDKEEMDFEARVNGKVIDSEKISVSEYGNMVNYYFGRGFRVISTFVVENGVKMFDKTTVLSK